MDVCSNTHGQRDWAYLLPEAIDTTVEKLDDSFSAFLSFISVCQRWRLMALEGKESKKKKDDNTQKLEILRTCRNQLPLLILEKSIQYNKVARCFLSVVPSYEDAVCYRLQKHRDLSNYGNKYFGSSFGWLLAQVTACPDEVEIILFNPLTCTVLYLPLLPDHPRCRIGTCNKGVLSSDLQRDEDYEVIVIRDRPRGLARYRSRNKSWTIMRVELEGICCLVDVVFYRGKIYASTNMGDLLEANFDTGNTRFVIRSYPTNRLSSVTHLVVTKLGDDLLMVKQMNSREFNVFKFCCCLEEEEVWKWVEINNLGDQALVVGCSGGSSQFSTCVSTMEFPKCRANCIYYTCSVLSSPGSEGRGVFNLELKQDLGIPCHDVGGGADGVGCASSSHVQTWIVPNLKGHD